MAFVPPGFANMILPCTPTAAGSAACITFGVDMTLGTVDPEDVADVAFTAFQSTVLTLLDDGVIWGPITAQVGDVGGILTYEGTLSSAGGVTIDCTPPNSAVLVRRLTSTPGRAGRGRIYWPHAAEETAVNESGEWNIASAENFQEQHDDWLTALEAADIPMVLLHSTEGTPSLVNSLVVQTLMASQRRRMRR